MGVVVVYGDGKTSASITLTEWQQQGKIDSEPILIVQLGWRVCVAGCVGPTESI